MKLFVKLSLIICTLLCCVPSYAQTEGGNEVFVPITKYLTLGDAESLSAWFADNLEISVLSLPTNSSKSQAKRILKSFFDSHTPRSFSVDHVAGRPNQKCAMGTLSAGGESMNVTIFLSRKEQSYKIQQLKIERVQ